ncbi:hypothetical protein BACCOP_00707 [Phocaeicola coprocola DSM 17136]|uniref:Uncharacterized protein n=1 Tax=Phocaeicola coprocola DSM 17136 TaxID=470145 RepID=B3JFQ6_9BACT|nr:hypothetical protein BACCOP_00707 [Phocaeicola coprocola DSM 17136]
MCFWIVCIFKALNIMKICMFLSFFVYKKEEKCCITEDYHYLCTRKSI